MEVRDAVAVLRKALNTDDNYRLSWQANIAMAFKDEVDRHKGEPRSFDDAIHEIANVAAERFLQALCAPVAEKPKSEFYSVEQRVADLKSIKDIQCSKGNYDVDEYMRGMANGLILACNIITEPYGTEPKYIDAPSKKILNEASAKMTDALNDAADGKPFAIQLTAEERVALAGMGIV